jgi:hypothetical protein
MWWLSQSQQLRRWRQEDCELKANLGKVRPYLKNKVKTKELGVFIKEIPTI